MHCLPAAVEADWSTFNQLQSVMQPVRRLGGTMKFVMCVSTRTARCAADCQSALAQSVCRCVVVWAGRYLNGKVADIDGQSVISYAVDVLGRSSRRRVYTAKSVDGLALSNHCCTLVCTRRTAGCVGRWSVERGAGRQHICLAPTGDVAVTSRVHVNSCTAEAEPVSLSTTQVCIRALLQFWSVH